MDSNQHTRDAVGLSYGATTVEYLIECLPIMTRKRAYQFFEERGRQPGHELDDWLRAEREVKNHLGI